MKRILPIAMWLAVVVGLSAQSLSLEGRLQRAVQAALATGDSRVAIQEYRSIVALAASNHAIGAKALLYQAEAEREIGDPDWRNTYARVVSQFSDQKDAVAKAQAALGAAGTDQAIARRIYNGTSPMVFERPSPDGRYFVASGTQMGLAVHDVISNTDRYLFRDVYINHPWFTPDGKRIVYMRRTGPVPAIQSVNLDGSGERTILSSDLYVELEVAGITEDGKTAAVGFHRKDKTWQVGMVSLETGKVTILRDTEWRDTYVGNFSPDGRWLVYATQLTKENDRDGAIYVVATDGSDHHPLVQHVLNLAPLFTPDGSRVVFRTSAPNNVDLSSIRVVDGKPVGSPELAKDGVGRPMGFTRDGSFYYYQSGGTREGVYTVDVSPAIWKIKSSPKQITSGLGGGLQGPPAWSPNGRLLAFAVRGTQTSGPRIVIHSFDASPERELSISRNALGRIEGWSEDGKSLVMAGGGKGLRLFDTDTQRDRVLMAPNEQGTDVSVTDGKVVFYPTFDGGLRQANTEAPPVRDTIRLRRRDLRTGDDRELYHEEFERSWRTVPALALSPDGHSLAYSIPRPDFKSTSLLVLPASGEAPRALPDIPMDSQVTWTPDSRALLFVRTSEIWVQPVDGSAAYSTGIHFSGIGSSLSVHPDGTRIAFIGSTPNRQVWAIKNLFSDTPAAK